VLRALADLLEVPEIALDSTCGARPARRVARIDNSRCIGCTKCIRACPVDAIVGAPRHQHHVLADRCTGCDLCLAPCPVDCIDMTEVTQDWSPMDAVRGRRNHVLHLERRAAAKAPAATPDDRDPLRALAAPAERARRLARILAAVHGQGAS
jgi:electron transport complex protein RnfB